MKDLTLRPLRYNNQQFAMTGVLISNGNQPQPKPGVLLAPNMMGITESNIDQAYKIAQQGYHVLVADLYGFVPDNAETAAAQMQAIKDTPLERERMQAALDALASQPDVDASKLAVVGFCYGGHCALELARSGANIRLAASIHGPLSTKQPILQKLNGTKIVVLNGAKDPFVPADMVSDFCFEMSLAKVDFLFVNYADAVHSFTYPKADVIGKMEYHPSVCNQAFSTLFSELHYCFTEHE